MTGRGRTSKDWHARGETQVQTVRDGAEALGLDAAFGRGRQVQAL